MTTTIPRSVFVAAIKKVTDDPRLIEVAEKQASFAVNAWERTDPKTGKPCGCVVGEFIFETLGRPEAVDGQFVDSHLSDVKKITGVNLIAIGIDIDMAVANALRDYVSEPWEKYLDDTDEKDYPAEDPIEVAAEVWGPIIEIVEDEA